MTGFQPCYIGPAGAKFVRAGAERSHFLGRAASFTPRNPHPVWDHPLPLPRARDSVVGELDDAELLAVGIEFVDEFSGDFHLGFSDGCVTHRNGLMLFGSSSCGKAGIQIELRLPPALSPVEAERVHEQA